MVREIDREGMIGKYREKERERGTKRQMIERELAAGMRDAILSPYISHPQFPTHND